MSQEAAKASQGGSSERRRFYRATIVPETGLRVRVWRMAPGVPLSRTPLRSQELRVDVRQVCVGGLTVAVGGPACLHGQVRTSDRLRIEVQYGDQAALLEGRLRDIPPASNDPRALPQTGVVFQGREVDLPFREARSRLTAIVGFVQREEIRHRRRMRESAAAA